MSGAKATPSRRDSRTNDLEARLERLKKAFAPVQPLLPIHYKPYGETLSMPTIAPSPQIEVVNVPHGAKPIMRQSVDIVLKVLNNLRLGGSWELTFVRQHTKKCNIKFQFVRQDPTTNRILHVRTKCGGKSSCWNVSLRIPDQQDPLKVVEDFKKIHPRTLEVQQRERAPQPTKPTVPVVRVEETKPKTAPKETVPWEETDTPPKPVPMLLEKKPDWDEAFSMAEQSNSAIDAVLLGCRLILERLKVTELQWEKFLAEQSLSPLKDACLQTLACEVRSMRKMQPGWNYTKEFDGLTTNEAFQRFAIDVSKPHRIDLPTRETIEKLFSTPKAQEPEPVQEPSPLRLDPNRHTDLIHNQDVLDKGLLALQPYFDPNGTIERIPAIDMLVERLDILDFIRQQEYYKDARRAVSQILRGLVNQQFLTRWTYGGVKGRKATTRAFIITPKGRDRLAQLQSPIPAPAQPRPALAAETVTEHPTHLDSNLLAKVEREAEAIKPLMDEHDSLNEDIAAYDEFLNESRRQLAAIEPERRKINSQMEELTREMDRITGLIENASKQRAELVRREAKLVQEMESYAQEKKFAVEKVASLKERIRLILYRDTPHQGVEKSELGT